LELFYEPSSEILVAKSSQDVISALDLSDHELSKLARVARERTLSEHTADKRALELERAIDSLSNAPNASAARPRAQRFTEAEV
jgi:spore maturation protein CgeB